MVKKLKLFLLLIMSFHNLLPETKIRVAPGFYMEANEYFKYYDARESNDPRLKNHDFFPKELADSPQLKKNKGLSGYFNKEIELKFNEKTKTLEIVEQKQETETDLKKNDEEILVENLPKVKTNPQTLNQIKEFLKDNRYPLLIGGTVLSLFTYLQITLRYRAKHVNRTDTWSCFKKNIPLEAFYEIPQDALLKNLLEVIYNICPLSKIDALYLFNKAVQQEIANLEGFINLYYYLTMPIVAWFFPNFDNELLRAQEKIERLEYMQELISIKIPELGSFKNEPVN